MLNNNNLNDWQKSWRSSRRTGFLSAICTPSTRLSLVLSPAFTKRPPMFALQRFTENKWKTLSHPLKKLSLSVLRSSFWFCFQLFSTRSIGKEVNWTTKFTGRYMSKPNLNYAKLRQANKVCFIQILLQLISPIIIEEIVECGIHHWNRSLSAPLHSPDMICEDVCGYSPACNHVSHLNTKSTVPSFKYRTCRDSFPYNRSQVVSKTSIESDWFNL